MTYRKSGVIQATTYNAFAAILNSVYADTNAGATVESSADYGYGLLPAIPLITSGNNITAAQWTILFNHIHVCGTHQGTDVTPIPLLVSPGDLIVAYNDYLTTQTLTDVISLLLSNRFKCPIGQFSLITGPTSPTSPSWHSTLGTKTLRYSFQIDFGTWDNARHFFNSGGAITLAGSATSPVTADEIFWSNMLTGMGTLRFGWHDTVPSSGPGSNVGFYDLTNTQPTKIYERTPNSGGIHYSNNFIAIYGQLAAPAGTSGLINFSIDLVDNDITLSLIAAGMFSYTIGELRPTIYVPAITNTAGLFSTGVSYSFLGVPLTLTTSLPTLTDTVLGAAIGTTPAITVTPAGGVPPYFYNWTNDGGFVDSFSPNTTSATVSVSKSLLDGEIVDGTIRCTVTDSSINTAHILTPWSMNSNGLGTTPPPSGPFFVSAAFSPLSVAVSATSALQLTFSGLTPNSTNVSVGNITLTPTAGISGPSGTFPYIIPSTNLSGVGTTSINYTGTIAGPNSVLAVHSSATHTGNVTVASPGVLPLTVSLSPMSVVNNIVGAGTNTSLPVVVTPHDGTAPYTYAWTNASASVTSVSLSNSGSGYTVAPGVVFSGGGGGIGATANAIIGPVVSGTSVASITLNNGGSGYTVAPGVVFSGGGGGVNAAATANITQTGSTGTDLWGAQFLAHLGAGYSSNPTVVISGSNIVVMPTTTIDNYPTFFVVGLTQSGATSPTLNDGTFPLVFTSVLGTVSYYTLPTGSVTVTGGVVTNITLGTAGVFNLQDSATSPLSVMQVFADTGGPGVRIVDCTPTIAALSTTQVRISTSPPNGGTLNTSTPVSVNWSGGGGPSGSTPAISVQTSFATPTYSVSSFTMTNNGTGYTTAPVISFSGPNHGAVGTAVLTVVPKVVSSITLNAGGSGYTTVPNVVFSGGGGGAGAVATAILGNVVPGSPGDPGQPYIAPTAVWGADVLTFTYNNCWYGAVVGSFVTPGDPAPVGATNVIQIAASGTVGLCDWTYEIVTTNAITTNPGQPYIPPTPGTPDTYSVIGFTITNGGTGYTVAPGVSFTGGGGGAGAVATAVITAGTNVVTSIVMTNGGTGYTVAPGVSFTGGGGGAGAVATATISAVLDAVTFNTQSGSIIPPGTTTESTTFSAVLTLGQTKTGNAILTVTDTTLPVAQVVVTNVPWTLTST